MSRLKLPKRGRLVFVDWDDSSADAHWGSDPKHPTPAKVRSVGYLTFKGRRRIVLNAGYARGTAEPFGERITILCGTIRGVRRVKVGRRFR